jgi:hypothetical protein
MNANSKLLRSEQTGIPKIGGRFAGSRETERRYRRPMGQRSSQRSSNRNPL